MFWIRFTAGSIVRRLTSPPDVIYSRSYPMSAALLGLSLKRRLRKPWVMHLSDPWADSPYITQHPRQSQYESECFKHADAIALTTSLQADYYRKKYPAYADKIFVSPNVMPPVEQAPSPTSKALQLVFAGNLYGYRSLAPILQALQMLPAELRHSIRLDVYGKTQSDTELLPEMVHYHGPVSFAKAQQAQKSADILVSVEPSLTHPLANAFLPSKVLESMAWGKPLLAITPRGSETEQLCKEGYGWAFEQTDIAAISAHLAQCIHTLPALRAQHLPPPPSRYAASSVVQQLLQHMQQLVAQVPA
jgi:glycosyltransferase involved in cell wall biosynthesis